jgi:hypothetical protein
MQPCVEYRRCPVQSLPSLLAWTWIPACHWAAAIQIADTDSSAGVWLRLPTAHLCVGLEALVGTAAVRACAADGGLGPLDKHAG